MSLTILTSLLRAEKNLLKIHKRRRNFLTKILSALNEAKTPKKLLTVLGEL